MPRLEPLNIRLSDETPEKRVSKLISDAAVRADKLQQLTGDHRIPALVTSDGLIAWRFLQAIKPHLRTRRPSFCEWGSGLGIVSCLAGFEGWTVTGLEIEPRLVEAARELAVAHQIDLRIREASYKPGAIYDNTPPEDGFGVGIFDFDIIYIYAWPAERELVTKSVARFGRPGTIFMRYGGGITCEAFQVLE